MKCCKCDAETESELGFIKKKGFRKDEVFCATCWEYQYHTNPKKHLIEFMIPGIIVAIFIWTTGQSALIFLANFFLLYLVFFPATVAHEFGHAAVVKLMGQDLLQIVFGRGKQLSEWKIGKSYLTLNLVPLGGVTLYAPIKLPLFKLRICLIYLAGPLVNLLIAESLRRSFL
jgi:hypothetical protein